MYHQPQLDINRIGVLLVLFLPVIIWTISDFVGVEISEKTGWAINQWTMFASLVFGINYFTGNKIKKD